MARQNILSQMFDIRPLNLRGELDMERIAQIRRILDLERQSEDLLKSSLDYNEKRIIDLREKIAPISADRPRSSRRSRKKSRAGFTDEQVLKSLLSGGAKNDFAENASVLERENILRVLDEIEQINQILKERGLEDQVAFEDAIFTSEEDSFDEDEIEEAEADDNERFELEDLIVEPVKIVEPARISPLVAEIPPGAPIRWEQIAAQLPPRRQTAPVASIFAASAPAAAAIFVPPVSATAAASAKRWPKFWPLTILGGVGAVAFFVVAIFTFIGRGMTIKTNIMASGSQAYQEMLAGKDAVARLDFSEAQTSFSQAFQNFAEAEQNLNSLGGVLVGLIGSLPGGDSVKSGQALIGAGKDLAAAGENFATIGNALDLKNFNRYFSDGGPSITQKFSEVKSALARAQAQLESANKKMGSVNAADLPANIAQAADKLKSQLPAAAQASAQIARWSDIFLNILGQERAKKYLLIFQNTAEARATGGFIGTYGVLDLNVGRLTNLKIDNVFNLDGQLYDKIVPPAPIQKISTAWSLHDANWFADFPASARKILMFYERAGGATADGVISLTPAVVERLLAITGPIDLPQYGVQFSSDNFVDLLQQKVEVDYDKLENQPKKILADFAPIFLEKLWQVWPQHSKEIWQALADSLAQKDILFYFSDSASQQAFVEQGWSGAILSAEKDYLNVINTNINGYKTDRVIQQKIEHASDVQPDGSIIDTVTVTRVHTGGKSQYDWYNRVNADYLRVYAPLGSQLISAQGQTREVDKPPVDYQQLKFITDSDVAAQEQGVKIDPASGTQIFTESGKTVFGNWTYVSPGKTVVVTYKYLLPFKLNLGVDKISWSLLAQKPSGSTGSEFSSILNLPQDYKITWQSTDNLQISGSQVKYAGDLKTDEFYGVVLGH